MTRAALLLAGAAALAACTNSATPLLLLPASQFAILAPSDGGAANEEQPTVRWTLVQGAATYEVSLYRDAARTDLMERHVVVVDHVRVDTALADGQKVYLEVRGLARDGSVVATGQSRCETVLLPDFFPALELAVHDPARAQGGYKLFNIFIRGDSGLLPLPILVLVNAAGEIVWYWVDAVDGGANDARVLENGNLLLIIGRGRPNGALTEAFEMTWDGTVVWKSRDGVQVHHEVGVGPGGHYLYLTHVHEEFDGVLYEGDGIELVDPATNQVLWEWNIFDHYDPADYQVPEIALPGRSGFGADWSHGNAVVWDPARSLMWVSIRHFDQIIGVDYPSGDVRVTLGEGGLGGESAMSHQHAPEVLDDGRILFWDNGNTHPVQESRAVIVDFDETTGRYEETWTWSDTPPFYDFAVGDADMLPNGNVLITAGVSGRLIEVTMGGAIVWELRLDLEKHFTYRAEQVPVERIPKGVLPFD